MKIVYHGTSRKNAEKIKRDGLDTHSWVTTKVDRAFEFAKIKTYKDGFPVVLKFSIPDDEFDLRSMLIAKSDLEGEVYRLSNYVFKHGYQRRLRPIGEVK